MFGYKVTFNRPEMTSNFYGWSLINTKDESQYYPGKLSTKGSLIFSYSVAGIGLKEYLTFILGF